MKWFLNRKLNITENIFERQLETHGDSIAIISEPNDPNEKERRIMYRELYEMTCQFSNAMEAQGISKGDRMIIYMPMVPEAAVAMMACARIGAIHSVVFAGFSAQFLADRINDCEAKIILTSEGNFRGTKTIPVKAVVDEALEQCDCVEKVILLKRTGTDVNWQDGHDIWWQDAIDGQSMIHQSTE